MASVTCPVCAATSQPGDLICMNCGANLARSEGRRETPHGPPPQGYGGQPPSGPPPGGHQQQGYGGQPHYGGQPQDPYVQPGQAPYQGQPGQGQAPQQGQQGYGGYPPPGQDRQPGDGAYGPPPGQQGQGYGGGYPPPGHEGQQPYEGSYAPPRPQPGPPQRDNWSPDQAPYPGQYGPPGQQQHPGPPPGQAPQPGGDSTSSFTPFCPHCGADVPDMGNPVCVQCMRPLHEKTRARVTLRVIFTSGEIQVAAGHELILGRDTARSPVAATFLSYDNVSRQHATLGVDESGQAWVRDDRSTNGTYVNDRRIPPGERVPLNQGDSVRLGKDAAGRAQLS